jgi:hypothetical protein
MKVKFVDLELALEFASSDPCFEHSAFLCKDSGDIFYDSDASEDVLPDDIYENDKYIKIPSKQDLDLGKKLVLKFVTQYLPDDIDTVYDLFRSRGAYSRFKSFLYSRDALENWYKYEQEAQKTELLNWCTANDVNICI